MRIYVDKEELEDILEIFGDARIASITKVGDNYVIEVKETDDEESPMRKLRPRIRQT